MVRPRAEALRARLSRYVNDLPTGTLPPGPLICGMKAPSLSGLYVNAWKCIE